METDRKWIIVRIDGKIAAISTDYRQLAAISARLAKDPKQKFGEITATAVDFEYIWKLRQEASWDDLLLYGTPIPDEGDNQKCVDYLRHE